MFFQSRSDAGRKLAQALVQYKDCKDTVILALPRGGVIVADQIATILNLPLDLIVTRKIGAPNNPEYAIGAITEKGEGIFNEKEISNLNIGSDYLALAIKKEQTEANRRLRAYRNQKSPLNLKDKRAIIIDDGIATGLTMRAAIKSVKDRNAKEIVVAVPVSARDSLEIIEAEVDKFICLETPSLFGAIGVFYKEFEQTSDEEVVNIMKKY